MKTKISIATLILSIGFSLAVTELHAQVTYSNITNTTLYAANFIQSTNSTGTSYNYTPGANGGTVSERGIVNSNSYGTNSVSVGGEWATKVNSQDGWTNFGVDSLSGPGSIYYNGSGPYKSRPAGLSIGADQFYATAEGFNEYAPQSVTNFITQSLYSATGVNAIHFDTTFWLYAKSPNSNGMWDTLGWTIMNSSKQSLLSINLDAITTDGDSWLLTATASGSTNKQALNIQNAGWSTLGGNYVIHLGFNIIDIGQTNMSVQVLQYSNTTTTNIPSVENQGSFQVLGTTQITEGTNAASLSGGVNVGYLANSWTIADTNTTSLYTNSYGTVSTIYTDYAQNNMLMQSLLISVPEPKTWILFGISGLIMVIALRRKA